MSDAELASMLGEGDKIVLATNGPDGAPHVVTLGYVLRGDRIWMWSYVKAQKVRNLERDDRATLLVEDGDAYDTYRGAMLCCRTTLHRAVDVVEGVGREILLRYGNEAMLDTVPRQAPKRVAMEFTIVRAVTYDHRQLAGGGYGR